MDVTPVTRRHPGSRRCLGSQDLEDLNWFVPSLDLDFTAAAHLKLPIHRLQGLARDEDGGGEFFIEPLHPGARVDRVPGDAKFLPFSRSHNARKDLARVDSHSYPETGNTSLSPITVDKFKLLLGLDGSLHGVPCVIGVVFGSAKDSQYRVPYKVHDASLVTRNDFPQHGKMLV